ncbi:hypothetical protein TRFO_21279 [Tritrichomonas foetus]|uniref:Uncharacterized protein n=1 Tax=Tritrichomonas foetus TaxID=1144522 RepID=A0A1J4KE92_9EUKA|nr:hypothetical protein TRFO_21279 [Tritrichomonas foetus]|eukprot:OHT09751.1 hypothetical protein TRFO_21279 [Tritrichomonas foetus]
MLNTDPPPITPTAPLHAGKRDQNSVFLSQFHTPFNVTPVKSGISSPHQRQIKSQTTEKIPLPTTPPIRKSDFNPFEAKNLSIDIKRVNDPDELKLRNALIFLILSVGFLASFLLGFHPEVCLLLSLFFFSIATYAFCTHLQRVHLKSKINTTKVAPIRPIASPKLFEIRPSEKFVIHTAKPPAEFVQSANTSNNLNFYRQFVNADRATASLKRVQLTVSQESNIDQLANDALVKLKLKSSKFNQYLVNMKSFLAKNLISKLALELHSESAAVDMMLSVPTFEHCRNYVIQRIRSLAASQYLAGHFGDRGDKYGEREWSKELPSDNQIILHILSVWLSYMMSHMRPSDQRPPLVFSHKFIAIGKEPKIETENDIVLCTDDFNKFYVMTKPAKTDENEASSVERYFAFPGRDSMYCGLTLFFYFVRERFDFLLDGADLQEPPLCMNRIYESARMT